MVTSPRLVERLFSQCFAQIIGHLPVPESTLQPFHVETGKPLPVDPDESVLPGDRRASDPSCASLLEIVAGFSILHCGFTSATGAHRLIQTAIGFRFVIFREQKFCLAAANKPLSEPKVYPRPEAFRSRCATIAIRALGISGFGAEVVPFGRGHQFIKGFGVAVPAAK